MMRAHRFSLAAGLSYALVIVVMTLASTFAIGYARAAAERRDHVSAEATLDAARAVGLHVAAEQVTSAARAYLLSRDPVFLTEMQRARGEFDDQMRVLRDRTRRPEEAALLDRINVTSDNYDAAVARVAALRGAAGEAVPATLGRLFEQDLVPRQRVLVEALGAYTTFQEHAVGLATREAERAFRNALTASAAGVVVALLASAVLGWRSARYLVRAYDAEQRAARVAADALAARDEVLGVVAHDLRNPLAAISMKAGLIRRGADAAGAIRQAGSIESIAGRMELLIRTLLDASVIQAGHFAVCPAPVSARGLFEEALEVAGGQAEAKSVRLQVRIPDPDLRVLADRERIGQALGNLVANAVKFTPSGGDIVVSAEALDGGVRFAVSDTGPGIAREDVPRVFDRFWTAKPGRNRSSGLGLYVARAIVEVHGGRIWVESQPGRGSTFYFTIPPAGEPIAPAPGVSPEGPSARE